MSSQQSRSPPLSNAHRSPRTINASPPPPPFTIATPSEVDHPASPSLIPEVHGQDHDRMETDEEDEDSESGAEADTPEAESLEGAPAAGDATSPEIQGNGPPPGDDEVMDTSPDNPTTDEHPPTPPQTSIGILTNEATGESTTLRLVHVQMPTNEVNTVQVVDAVNAAGQANTPEEREARLRATERELAALGDAPRVERARHERRRPGREERQVDDDGERDDDDSDESDSEDEHPFWANLKEDTTIPDERELKFIEENIEEISALDHQYWEKKAFEPLDDPEYVPGEGHRISWTVTGVHGTPEKPNREKIMRSPSKLIDGYYWNIKYYPHGNDGTEQLSIYIECSPTPWEDLEAAAKKAEAPKELPNGDQGPTVEAEAEQNGTSNPPAAAPAANEPPSSVSVNDAPSAPEEDVEATPTSPKNSKIKKEEPWGIAAQISCVIYNPDEPRVNAGQKGCHRYYNDNPDWGWTRFHGPWDEIHKRQRYQRQALLRNDTLAFTAYIRTIKDDTKALWWHPPKDKSDWDCLAMTGVRAFCNSPSAMIAAISSWLHLSPIVDLIRNMHIPDPVWEANIRQRPAYEELQDILDADANVSSTEDRELCLENILNILNFYGAGIDSKMDVVIAWEIMRCILNYEASGLDTIAECNSPRTNKFSDVLVLKQPDPFNNDTSSVSYRPSSRSNLSPMQDFEPHSIQETIDLASQYSSKAFRMWRSFAGEEQVLVQSPSVLQVELHRQSYSKDARKWKKLTHKIEMNENVLFNAHEYTLYGMIVHSGDLESPEYYSVIRPEGPGTRWVKYGGDNCARKVEVLTTKKAVQAHEGVGENTDGTAAIAYVAMYVRKDMLSSVLCTPFKHKGEHKADTENAQVKSTSEIDGPSESKDIEESMLEPMPVYIYSSELFQGYTGRGLCDPWTEQRRAVWVKELKYAPRMTLDAVKKHLIEAQCFGQNIRLWPMNTLAPSSKAYPELLSFEAHKSESLEEIVNRTGGSRFWLIPGETDPVLTTASASSSPSTGENPIQTHEEGRRRSTLLSAAIVAEAAIDHVSEAVTGGDDTEMAEATDALRQNAQNVDAPSMEEAIAAAQAHAHLLQQQRNAGQQNEATPVKKTYFLLKVFDAESQSLRGVCGRLANSEAKIAEEVKKLLKVDSQESWDLYQERCLEIRHRDQIKSNATFNSEFDGTDGNIIIAQRHPTSSQYVPNSFIIMSNTLLTPHLGPRPSKPKANAPIQSTTSCISTATTIPLTSKPTSQAPTSAASTVPAPSPWGAPTATAPSSIYPATPTPATSPQASNQAKAPWPTPTETPTLANGKPTTPTGKARWSTRRRAMFIRADSRREKDMARATWCMKLRTRRCICARFAMRGRWMRCFMIVGMWLLVRSVRNRWISALFVGGMLGLS